MRNLALQSLPPAVMANGGRLLVTPAPLNTVLWRIVAQDEQHYYEGFHSLLDPAGPIRFQRYESGGALAADLPRDNPAFSLQSFALGFVRFDDMGGELRVADLRMGQEPHYAFSFVVAERGTDGILKNVKPRAVGSRANIGESWSWLIQRISGKDLPAP